MKKTLLSLTLVLALCLPCFVGCDMNDIFGMSSIDDVDDEKSNNKRKPSKETETITETETEIQFVTETETAPEQECDHPFANMVMHESKAPTCTEIGWDAYVSCSKCGMSNCVEKAALGHEAGAEATCTEPQRCTRCQVELAAAKGHTPGAEATCTDAQMCSTCGDVIEAEQGHDFVDRVCSICGEAYTSSGFEYQLNGDGTCYVFNIGSCNDNDIVIPSISPNGYKVTGIVDSVFNGCSNLTSIVIPEGVTFIADNAFKGCTSLTSITIPDSVTSICVDAFYGCSQLIQVENGVSYVDKWVIDCESNIADVVWRDNTVGIGAFAFDHCKILTSIVIPEGVKSICDWAFMGTSLRTIVIPEEVTRIGYEAFRYCDSLETIYYTGTEEEWEAIKITSEGNEALQNATIIFNYVPEE